MKKAFKTPSAPALTSEEALRMGELFDKAAHDFRGTIDELESAIGMYALGRHFGWKVLYIVHSKKTIKKYEELLGISIRDEFPEEGPEALRSMGYTVAKSFSNFWKVVSGEEKVDRSNWRTIE